MSSSMIVTMVKHGDQNSSPLIRQFCLIFDVPKATDLFFQRAQKSFPLCMNDKTIDQKALKFSATQAFDFLSRTVKFPSAYLKNRSNPSFVDTAILDTFIDMKELSYDGYELIAVQN